MGRWIKRTDGQHKHDMPGPIILSNQEALPGWQWECTCLIVFELVSYSLAKVVWKDLSTGKLFEVIRERPTS